MANFYGSDCDETILSPECNGCIDDFELAGIGSAALVHKSYYATLLAGISNPVVWEAGYNLGKIKIVPTIRGDFDGGSPKLGDGYARRKVTYLGSDYKGNLYDPNYVDNAAFWNSVLPTFNWHVAINTESQTHLSTQPVTFAPGNPISTDITVPMEWKVEFSWFQQGLFLPHPTPVGIFDCSFLEV